MKTTLFFSMLFATTIAVAQPQVIKQAIVSTTTTVIAPEGEDVQNIQGGGGNQMFRNFGDGETKSTTYVKDSLVKTVMKNDMGRSTIIRNNASKLTTTLIEMMGNKTGFYVTDEEQAALKVQMDSMMKARRNNDSSRRNNDADRARPANSNSNNAEVVYTDETKKIAGYNCKKAIVIRTNLLGIKDSLPVWYTPEIKIANLTLTGGTSSFGGFGGFGFSISLAGLEKVDGFIMQYEMNMRRGRKMTVEVTKIDLKKEVTDKDFEIPKDFDVKPMKVFQGMMQTSGMQFRQQQ